MLRRTVFVNSRNALSSPFTAFLSRVQLYPPLTKALPMVPTLLGVYPDQRHCRMLRLGNDTKATGFDALCPEQRTDRYEWTGNDK